jgi:outer membrane protein assembly factor BamA
MRRISAYVTVLVLLASSSIASSPPRLEYRVEGNRALSENRILSILRTAPEGRRIHALQEAYLQEGFLRARIEVGHSPVDSTTIVSVYEGARATVASSVVSGATVVSEKDVRTTLLVRPGDRFRPVSLREGVDDLLRRYDNAGHPFAQVWFDSVAFDSVRNQVDIGVTVVEGEARKVSSVRVEGLSRTREDIAVRMTGIETGKPYTARAVETGALRLTSSGLFDQVDAPTIRLARDGSGVDAVLTVSEPRQSHSFSGAVGYAAPEDQAQERILSGLVDLRLRNIGGTLKDLGVFWTNDGVGRSETRIRFRDRFFLGRLLSVNVGLEQIGQRGLYTWQSLGAGMEKPVGRAGKSLLTLGLSGNVDRNVYDTGDLLRSWRYRGALTASFLRGNRRRTGLIDLRTRFTYASKNNVLRADSTEYVTQLIIELEGEASASLARLVHVRVVPVYRSIESDELAVPLSEQFYIGGARTLRGYRENQFHSRRVGTLSGELLVGPGRWESGYLFVDVGYVLQETVVPFGLLREDLWPVGFGFGFRTGSRVGNIDLSFGMGEEISLQQTKVHVLLMQNF